MRKMHIYAFGSICRGQIDSNSDTDLLAITTDVNDELDVNKFSIYSHERMREIWGDGNPFAWHLHHESRLLYASDGSDFLLQLGEPNPYRNRRNDCLKFLQLLRSAYQSIELDQTSACFDLSAAFLAVRNFSSCFILGANNREYDFSRNVAITLMGHNPPISREAYSILERARLLCTRGYGRALGRVEIETGMRAFNGLELWMTAQLEKIHGE
jgi:hypothetical protein